VANLCDARAVLPGGGSALLDLSTLPDDAERLREIREWSLAQLKTTEAQDIVPRMGQVAPKDRGQALRAEAARAGIAPPCALADALDRPLPAVAKPLVSALPTLTITGYESDKAARRYTGAALDAVRLAGAAINACYASGLARDPRLSGKLSIKLSLDASGKVVSSTADGVSLGDKRVVKCIQTDGVSAMSFPKPEKGPVKFSVGLSLAPATSMGAPSVTVLALQGRPKG
jgi:lambda repressor-like predicted transcriptional regulator